MRKLWIFGDSYSEPFSKFNGMEWKPQYASWKGYMPKYYGDFLTEEFKLFHINNAIGGADNYTIFEKIISFLDKINSKDIIIIGWSHTLRFRIVNNVGGFNTIRPSILDDVFELNGKAPYMDLSDNTIKEIVINRNSNLYINEVNNFIKILNFSFKKNTIIHWSPFRQDLNGMLTTIPSILNLEMISDETDGIVKDSHFSENAHKKLAERFSDVIINYESFKIKKSFI